MIGGEKRVFVGMSGGVDSAVSAALLKEARYDVTGVFIKAWHPDFLECTWRDDRNDAMTVCAHLGIPFETCDLESEYKRDVVDYLIAEYARGRTPNPDVMCNRHVKFGAFYAWARERGADMIATGHYARISGMPEIREPTTYNLQPTTSPKLLMGVDTAKDQSYFLWGIDRHVLPHIVFPVGGFTKPQVRVLARERGLSVAAKKDSQGICFMGHVSMADFLARFVDIHPGNVLDVSGKIIGTHTGALAYTIGQRHGFTVTNKRPDDGPWYVVTKDIGANTITVSHNGPELSYFSTSNVALEDTNWFSGTAPEEHLSLTCRFRYRQPPAPCSIVSRGEVTAVQFETSQFGVTPGQSLVIYNGDVCLGGGVIT